MQPDTALSLIDVGVDYVTCTAPRDDQGERLNEVALSLMQEQQGLGYDSRLWKGQGYHGKAAGGVQVGLRYDGYIVRLSSTAAASHYRQVLTHARNVSRIDLQITAYDSSHLADRAHIAYYLVDDAPRRGGRPPSASLRINNHGGQTLYVGSRQSDVYGRFYDKGIESKAAPAGWFWRQEIEAKRKVARTLATDLLTEQSPADRIARTVVAFFAARGIPGPPHGSCRDALNLVADRAADLGGRSDHQRRLRWLQTAVAPSVRKMVNCGGREAVLSALGLGGQ